MGCSSPALRAVFHLAFVQGDIEIQTADVDLSGLHLMGAFRGNQHLAAAVQTAVLHHQGAGGHVAVDAAGALQAQVVPGGDAALDLARHPHRVGGDGPCLQAMAKPAKVMNRGFMVFAM